MSDVRVSGVTLSRLFKLNGRTDLEKTTGVRSIKEAIETLMLTNASNPNSGLGGDRVYNRKVGLNIIQYLFRTDTPTNRAALKDELLKIPIFEPRIDLRKSGIIVFRDPSREHVWIIKLRYRILQTGETRNQVTPLFVRERFTQILPPEALAA